MSKLRLLVQVNQREKQNKTGKQHSKLCFLHQKVVLQKGSSINATTEAFICDYLMEMICGTEIH